MTNKQIPTHHDDPNPNISGDQSNPADVPRPAQIKHLFKLGIDLDLNYCVVAIQCDHGAIKPAQKMTRPQLITWIKERIAAGHIVHTVYESCGLGYTLHRELVAAGAHSLVITPTRLDQERRRKNDRLDARELCVRLSRYLAGNKDELATIRVPSVAEQQRREYGRQRDFWGQQLRRLENHGRALRLEYEHQTLPGGWAGPRKWKALAPQLSEFVRWQLEPIVEQIRHCKAQLTRLTAGLEQLVAQQTLPKGLGALTAAVLDGEICDWNRFRHRKAVGSYTGCCPSEHSSGGTQRLGSIDRHGNRHVRRLLVEAVWRLIRYQPNWHAYKKLLSRLANGASLKKKTVVALARQLAIDLWRWRTGRCTLADLGLIAA
jgi:transposase